MKYAISLIIGMLVGVFGLADDTFVFCVTVWIMAYGILESELTKAFIRGFTDG